MPPCAGRAGPSGPEARTPRLCNRRFPLETRPVLGYAPQRVFVIERQNLRAVLPFRRRLRAPASRVRTA